MVELLRGAPTYGVDVDQELTTPTGAAILAGTVSGWGPLPAMRIESSGFGAGSRDPDDRPNVTQVVVGTRSAEPGSGQPVALLEANVDDATGEVLAHVIEELLAAGAHDAWVTPVVGKKGRPAHVVSVLCDPTGSRRLAGVLARESGSLGVRVQGLERWPAARQIHEIEVDGVPVRMKVTAGRAKPEYDDAARAARRLGVPVREVISRAEQAWRSAHPDEGAQPSPDGATVIEMGAWHEWHRDPGDPDEAG